MGKQKTHENHTQVWSKGQNSPFSKHGHVAYQIKGNHKCSKQHDSKYVAYQIEGGRVGQNASNNFPPESNG